MTIDLTIARDAVDAAVRAAAQSGVPAAAVVTDRAGTIVAAARMDGAAPLTVELARRKAHLAAALGAPTHVIAEMAAADATLAAGLASIGDVLVLPGAVPIVREGVPVGALGVSGGHYSQDRTIAEAAIG